MAEQTVIVEDITTQIENHDYGSVNNSFNVETEFPAFLQSVLDRAMYFIDDNTSMNINDTQTYLVVIDRTISLLRQILWDVDDDDRQEWQVIEGLNLS